MITWLLWCKKQKNTSTENRLIQKLFTKKCVFFKIGIFPSSKCILHNSNLRNVKVNGNVANVAFSAHCSAELKNIFEKGNDKTSPIKPVSPAEVISLCMVERLCCFKWDANQMQPCAQKGSDSLIISVQCSVVFFLLFFFLPECPANQKSKNDQLWRRRRHSTRCKSDTGEGGYSHVLQVDSNQFLIRAPKGKEWKEDITKKK